MIRIIEHKRSGRAVAVNELGIDQVQGKNEMEAIINLERRERKARKPKYDDLFQKKTD